MHPVRDDRRSVNLRLSFLRFAIGLGLGILFVGYWYHQFIRGTYYRDLSENNRLRKITLHAVRGVIRDRDGRIVAHSEPAFDLRLFREETKNLHRTRRFVVSALGLPADDVDRRLTRARGTREYAPVRLAEDVPMDIVAKTSAHAPEELGLEIAVTDKRSYLRWPRVAHVLGYLGEATPAQIERDPDRLSPGDQVGHSGLEAAFDRHLAGKPGESLVVVDSLGRKQQEWSREEATPGRGLQLTLDLRLQAIAEDYFRDKVGAVVALDPRDGAVLALAAAPDFDPNDFVGRLSPTTWKRLLSDPHRPLQNRALQNTYSPGSVFKVVMAYAALERGLVSEGERVFCPGSATIYGHTYRCHKSGGHGWVDLETAVEVSCDVYFYQLGRRLGVDAIAEAARRFGLGTTTGIELAPEKAGLVPSEAWSQKARGHGWWPGETISVAIGQGPLLVTPIQLARMTAAVANGGRLVTPHLVVGRELPEPAQIPMSEATQRALARSLWRVVNEARGTGGAARVPGVAVCGKTGTVQVVTQKVEIKSEDLAYEVRDHAWFVAYAPMEAPTLAVAIFVEHGGHGSAAAAPLAQRLIAAWVKGEWPEVPPEPPAVPDVEPAPET